MKIKSNTLGKVKKIISGTVFSNEFTFVKEFLQNTQRAKAKDVFVNIEPGIITFEDNGVGCKNPENIFTLDLSSWESTTEGFGIGFWSCLALENLERIEVESHNWKASLNLCDIKAGNLDIHKEVRDCRINGFKVSMILNDYFETYSDVMNEIGKVGKYLDQNIYVNGTQVKKINIFENVDGDYVKYIENKLFKAVITIESERYCEDLWVFYDKREVRELYGYKYVRGIIEMKKDKITLKEPDRTDFCFDEKYRELTKRVEKEVKELYKDFVNSNPSTEMLDKYSDAISKYLDVKDYEKKIDVTFLLNELEDLKKANDDTNNECNINESNVFKMEKLDMKSRYLCEEIDSECEDVVVDIEQIDEKSYQEEALPCEVDENTLKDVAKLEVNNTISTQNECSDEQICDSENEKVENSCNIKASDEVYGKVDNGLENQSKSNDKEVVDVSYFEAEDHTVEQKSICCNHSKDTVRNIDIPKDDKLSVFKKMLKKIKKIAWVLDSDRLKYQSEISQAEYMGIKVINVPNVLYAKLMEKYSIMNISQIKDCYKESFDFKEIKLKNKKEERFIENLIPICKHYNLPLNTFLIGKIDTVETIEYEGKVISKEKKVSTKEKVYTNAVCKDGKFIVLDRRFIDLSRFSLSKGVPFGINDLKSVMASLKTIAHELAHLLYNTEDNTVNHYNVEDKIYKEVLNLYI